MTPTLERKIKLSYPLPQDRTWGTYADFRDVTTSDSRILQRKIHCKHERSLSQLPCSLFIGDAHDSSGHSKFCHQYGYDI
jgi:hypothetical protein